MIWSFSLSSPSYEVDSIHFSWSYVLLDSSYWGFYIQFHLFYYLSLCIYNLIITVAYPFNMIPIIATDRSTRKNI